jgi:penicillin-binding protein 1A
MVRRELRVLPLAALTLLVACMAPPDGFKARPIELRSTIVAADGTPLANLFEKNRRAVRADQIPDVMKRAIVAAEDGRFYSHRGVDATSALRALLVDVTKHATKQGGSTITQQLAKMMYGGEESRTWKRKLVEARAAMRLESRFSKDQLLTMYLNRAYFGAQAYGIKAAVETYYAKPLMKLRTSEAALLAGLVRAPTVLNPFANPGAAKDRRSYVLRRMSELGMITEAQRAKADAEPLHLHARRPVKILRAPYFVTWIQQQVLNNEALGPTREDRERMLLTGGLRIRTTLDVDMQEAAEAAVADVLDRPDDPEAAVIAIDPRSGEIKAMVGGRSFKRSQFNAAVQAMRQPGSAFKPFVLAAALEDGISPEARYASSPTTLHLPDGSTWPVDNFDGRSYGTITLRKGMIRSVNGVYARLVVDVGPRNVVDVARRAGITSPLDPFHSIALGALRIGVSPLQMASAYGTFAANGAHYAPHGVLQVRGRNGALLEDNSALEPKNAIDPQTAYTVTDVLRDVAREGTARPAAFGRPMAAKTGTTEEHKDAWLVGYTPELVTAVWVGYRTPKPMRNVHGIEVVGGSFPAQIWRSFMREALKDRPERDFTIPGGKVKVRVGDDGKCLDPDGELVELAEPLVPTRECSGSSGDGEASPDPSSTTVVVEPTIEPNHKRKKH